MTEKETDSTPELHEKLQELNWLTDAHDAEPGMTLHIAMYDEIRSATIEEIQDTPDGDLRFITADIVTATAREVNESPNMVIE